VKRNDAKRELHLKELGVTVLRFKNEEVFKNRQLVLEKIFQTSTGDILVGTWGKGWFIFDKDFHLKKQFYDSIISRLSDDEYRKNLVLVFC